MSLLQNLPYKEYKYISTLSTEKCEVIAKLADLKLVTHLYIGFG